MCCALLLAAFLLAAPDALPQAWKGRLGGASRLLPPPAADREKIESQGAWSLEEVIEETFRSCFYTRRIEGRSLSLRLPFGQNGERRGEAGFSQEIFLGGKGAPEEIWERVGSLLDADDFRLYSQVLQVPVQKVIRFDLELAGWKVSAEPRLLELLEQGPYPGTRTRVFVLKRDSVLSEVDVYNYLYCVGAVGLDCSGFVYHILKAAVRCLGADLEGALAERWRLARQKVPLAFGLWTLDPEKGYTERVRDAVENLRPADIFLFRGRGGAFRHSAVIQSIDRDRGLIRYVQCTDWAPQEQRGSHESFIRFDPAHPEVSLGDSSVRWTQGVLPAFTGEPGLRYWRNDGDRYRAFWPTGRSLVVRLKLLRTLIERVEPGFYVRGGILD